MTTKISSDNIQDATLATIGSGPKITQVLVCNSSYTVLDDTAVDTAGGYLKIVGSGFKTGATVTINRQPATSVTFVSATELRAQVPAEAAGTYVVYVVNTDGGVALRVNGITFSALPSWTTASTLPTGDSGTAISIQLAAAQALTYSVAGNSTLPPGLTLSSGGLLSGTITVVNETLYNFSVVATDAELQDSPRTFSITITAGDLLFAATTLLLPGSATTFVRDASVNNFAVSVFGDTRPNTFNPYLTGWSNYFDGTGDYLSVPDNAALNPETDNFIMECWVYITGLTGNNQGINGKGTVGTDGYTFYVTNSLLLSFIWNGTGGATITAGTLSLNTWHHVAVVRNSDVIRLYLDGVGSGSSTACTTNITSTALKYVGQARGANPLLGYMSNYRLIKGTLPSGYDATQSSITVPTTPLTAVANTSLLTCQSNRFRDASTNNSAITPFGDVAVRSFSPFAEPATTRGSAYFDGTGDYLTVGSSTNIALGSADWTVEAWIYPTSVSIGQNIIVDWRNSNSTLPVLYMINNQVIWRESSATRITSSTTLTANTWYHVAVVKVSTTTTMYINGVSVGSYTDTTNYANADFKIGKAWDANHWNGYISNLRIVKGTAVYTDNFTPPTEPLTAVANTSLLTLQTNQPHNNNQFLDSSSNNHLITRSGNATQGTFSPYSPSGWSVYFNGTSDYFNSSGGTGIGGTSFGYGTGDFTWETWVFPTSSTWTSGNFYILDHGQNSGTVSYTANKLRYYNGTVQIQDTDASGLLPVNTWTHVAISRISGTTRIFVNGALQRTVASDTHSYGTSAQLWVGRYGAGGNYFPGYMSNFRIVRGVGVYSGTFTPSTTPLTAAQSASTNIAAITNQTVLLICQDNSFANESFVPLKFDSGTTLAIGGSPRIQNFSPFKAVVQTPVTYSTYFDGSGDSIQVGSSNTGVTFGTADFTIETWIYWNSLSSESAIMFGNGIGWTFYVYPANKLQWGRTSPQTPVNLRTGNTTLNTGTWYHIAVTRASGTVTLWVNGVSDGTVADSANYSASGDLRVGISHGGQFFNGYMSNVRVVKGTAVYTSTFTPSTTPLTAITNTSVLTCQSATFIDNSTNNFAITAVGNSQPTTVNPFGFTFANSTGYTVAEYSGSMSFDGSGDYLTVPANSAFSFTGNFTIEFWVYLLTNLNTSPSYFLMVLSGPTYFAVNMQAGSYITAFLNTSSHAINATDVPPIQNAWNHIALVRSGSTVKIYVNGKASTTTATNSSTLGSSSASFNIANGSCPANYMSDFRIVKGQAVYTSNFVPPLAPVTPVQNTVLLLNGTSAAIRDATTRNVLETVGDAKISTAVAKFGGSSMYFDGSGDYLHILDNPFVELGSGNFTIEGWFYWAANSGNWCLFHKSNSYELKSDSNRWVWQINANTNVFVTGWAPTLSTWYHIALVRNGATTTLYINGSAYTNGSSTNANDNTAAMTIGSGAGGAFNGYIQDFRITRGHARYTASFTPPATALKTK